MKKLFCGFIQAIKDTNGYFTVNTMLIYGRYATKQFALESFQKEAALKFPCSEGYTNQSADTIEIPLELMCNLIADNIENTYTN